jgi:hypothetical protein
MYAEIVSKTQIEPPISYFRDGSWVAIPRDRKGRIDTKAPPLMFTNTARDGEGFVDRNGTQVHIQHSVTLASPWEQIQKQKRHRIQWYPGKGPSIRPYRAVSPWRRWDDDTYDTPSLTAVFGGFWHKGKLYVVVQCEGVHDVDEIHGGYGRAAIAMSHNGLDRGGYKFLKLDDRKRYGPKWSPILESWQPMEEAFPDKPHREFFGLKGIAATSCVIPKDEPTSVYIFYTRFCNTARYNPDLGGYPTYGFPLYLDRQIPPKPNDSQERWDRWNTRFNGVCLAKLDLTTWQIRKYQDRRDFYSPYWVDNFRGVGTKIISYGKGDPAYPHVHWNWHLGKWVMVAQGEPPKIPGEYRPKIVWYTSNNLTNWEYHGILLDMDPFPAFYPVVANLEGKTTSEAGQFAWLIWISPAPLGGRYLQNRSHRSLVRFDR